MFCRRKIIVDTTNREHVRKINQLLLQKKFFFTVGEGKDVIRGWCNDATVENQSLLVLTDVILDVSSKSPSRKTYQEHSELRFFNTPFAAFVNEGDGVEAHQSVFEED